MRSVRRLLVLSLLATTTVIACSADEVTNPFAPLALSLTLSPSVDTIFVSDSISSGNSTSFVLSATSLSRPIKTPRGVVWSSSNPSVAFVDSAGSIFAASRGETTITARINSDRAHANVVVAYRATRLLIQPTSISGHVGDTLSVIASALDNSGFLVNGMIYTFASADPTVASVTKIGTRTARVQLLKTGTARITVVSGGLVATTSGPVTP
jgi:uncharacterized protein YjdB